MYGIRHAERPAILTIEIQDQDRTYVAWLPEEHSHVSIDSLVWEDETHVLVAAEEMSEGGGFMAARVDVISGQMEWMEMPVQDPNIIFVRPMATAT